MKRYLFAAAAMVVFGTAAPQAAGHSATPTYQDWERCRHLCYDCPIGPIVKPGHPPVIVDPFPRVPRFPCRPWPPSWDPRFPGKPGFPVK